jgi:SHS2 domain-containing protein
VQPTFELFDHTADMGIRVTAPTLADLVRPAADGLYAVIGDLVPGAAPRPAAWEFQGDDPATLLRDYLGELLLLFEKERRMVANPAQVDFTDQHLAIQAQTVLIDDARSAYEREVKAVTYHELAVARIPGGWQATVIVDI